MTHRKFKMLMVESFYNELSPETKKSFAVHHDECMDCAEAYKNVTATLAIMKHRQRPEPGEAYWNGYWARLESELHQTSTPKQNAWLDRLQELFAPRFAYAIGAAVLLIALGVVVGRFMMQPESQLASRYAPPPTGFSLEQTRRTEEYLDRSRTLLLGIVNADTTAVNGHAPDLSRQRRVSRELLDESRVLQAELKGPDQARLRKLVSDLEVIMLQIANLEAQYDSPAIEIVKNGVDRSALLLKINLEQMQMDKHTPQPKTERPNS